MDGEVSASNACRITVLVAASLRGRRDRRRSRSHIKAFNCKDHGALHQHHHMVVVIIWAVAGHRFHFLQGSWSSV